MSFLDRWDRRVGGCLAAIVGVPFTIFGLWAVADAGSGLWRALGASELEVAAGVVQSVEDPMVGGLEVVVGYEVDGQTLETSRMAWGAHRVSQEEWEDRLQVGGPVEVFYLPEDPTSAALLAPDVGANLGVLALGSLFLVVGALLVLGRFRASEML